MKKTIGLVWILGLAFAATAQEIVVQYDFNGDPGTAYATTTHADVAASSKILLTTVEWFDWDIDSQNVTYHPQDQLWFKHRRVDPPLDFNVTIQEGRVLTLNSLNLDYRGHNGAPFNQITWYYNDTDDGSGEYTLLGSVPIADPALETFLTFTVTPETPPNGLSGTVHLRAVFGNDADYSSGCLDNITLNGTIEDGPIQGTVFYTQ